MKKPNETLDEMLPKELPCDIHEDMDSCPVIDLKARLNTYYSQLVVDARADELLLACKQWEKDPSRPATYLINRKQQLGLSGQSAHNTTLNAQGHEADNLSSGGTKCHKI